MKRTKRSLTYFHVGFLFERHSREAVALALQKQGDPSLSAPEGSILSFISCLLFFTFTILVRKIFIYICHIILTTLYTHVVSGIRRRTDQKLRWERGNVNGLLHETMDQQRPQIVSQRGNLAFEMILSEFKRESLLKRFNSFNSSTRLYHP